MVSAWEEFYAKHPPPQDLAQSENALKAFTHKHMKKGNKVVLVTVSENINNTMRDFSVVYRFFITLIL